MVRLWLSTLLLASVPLTGAARAEEAPARHLDGGTRWYGGTTVERRLAVPEGVERTSLAWALHVFRAEVAAGRVEVAPSDPWLRVEVPEVARGVSADLVLAWAGQSALRVPVTLHPPASAVPWGRDPIGWVGPGAPDGARVHLRDGGAVRRFRGRTIVLAPGAADVGALVGALLAHARRGGTVLSLGVDGAPWVADADPPPIRQDRSLLLCDLPPVTDGRWARGGGLAKSPLRPPAGRTLDLVPGLVRVAWVGSGCFVVARLRVVEDLHDEPLAASLLLRLRAVGAYFDSLRLLASRARPARAHRFWRD